VKGSEFLTNVAQNDRESSSIYFYEETLIIVALIVFLSVIIGAVATAFFNYEQMTVINPLLASCSLFSIFCYLLWRRTKAYLFGEIGFIYVFLALAYTVSPAVKILLLDFNLPIDFDGLNFAVLSPKPAEIANHFWRHVIFVFGISAGYLIIRGGTVAFVTSQNECDIKDVGWVIMIISFAMGGCILVVSLFLPIATTYIEHYTRFDNLSPFMRKVVEVCWNFKTGAYFVLLALMFSQYKKYKWLIFFMVAVFCIFEVVYSLGSRIVSFTIIMAVLGFYHFRVSPFSLKKSSLMLAIIAIVFSFIGLVRHFDYSFEDAQHNIFQKNDIRAMEFEAVFCTGFHLYFERENNTLPPRDWRMFFNDIISVIPFVDHITFNPQYWYARNYFQKAEVPPTTMGVLADSALWGGEFDLIFRSFINGAFFAFLVRWFLARKDKWWALVIYVYCFATSIMTLKYSILYQLSPLIRTLLPPLILTFLFIRINNFYIKAVQKPNF
jgi:hypothetical protein